MRQRKAKVDSYILKNRCVKEPNSVGEITRRLERLQDQLQVMFESIGDNHMEENGIFLDVRVAELVNCKSDISINLAILNIFVQKEEGQMTASNS
jgi:hypothetical protein